MTVVFVQICLEVMVGGGLHEEGFKIDTEGVVLFTVVVRDSTSSVF